MGRVLEKVRNLRDQPCCGYFLQGGGISLFAMILIISELIRKFKVWVDMRKDENTVFLYYVRGVLWSSYFAIKIVIIGLSVFLFKTARRRNGRLCKLWIFLSVTVNLLLVTVAVTNQILFKINAIILIFLAGYLIYKVYSFHVVYTFVREIKSYGGFNACLSGLTDAEVEEFEKGHPPEMSEMKDQLQLVKKQAFNKDFEVPIDKLDIDLEAPLGSGAFGTAYRAKLFGGGINANHSSEHQSTEGGSDLSVAVKTVHHNADAAYFKTLLGELKIMTFLPPHENVVNLIGACTSHIKDKKLYIVVELCPFGNLHDYLKARRGLFVNYVKGGDLVNSANGDGELYRNVNGTNSVSTWNLLQWSYETCKGMNFLEEKKVIHGDLALRNLLLGYGRSIKITDFGLSKKLYQYTTTVKSQDKLLPWRWMSIEALKDLKFSSKSDVWSYGVTIWEMFSLSELPFPGFTWSPEFISDLTEGLRMKQPPYAPNIIYEDVMLKSWHLKEDARPCFGEIGKFFEENFDGFLTRTKVNESDGPSTSKLERELSNEVEVYIGNALEISEQLQSSGSVTTSMIVSM